uniref:C2H2-type domain-containing protein n=1 Tax=Plectus sambesii TaxID=2011161 RepID=A0A914VFY8_9BILA
MDADMVGVAAVDGDHLRRSKRNKFRLDIVGMQFQLPHGPNKPRARGKSSVTPIKNAKCDLKDAKAHKSAAAAQNGQSGGWSDGAGSTPPRKADVRTVVDKTVGASASASSSAIQPIPNDSPAQIATKQRRSMPTEKRASSAKKYKSDSPIAEQSPVTVPTESPADASTAPPLIEPQYMDAMKSERDEQAASPVETVRKSNDTDESSPSNNDPNADGDFSCVHCPAKYDSRTGLANHLKLHGAHKRFPCNRCDFSCDNPKTMRSHRRMHGPESGVVNGSKAIAKGLIVKKLKKRHVQSLTSKRASTYAASRGIASSSATGDGPPALTPMSPLVLLEEVRGAGGSTEKKTDIPQPSPASHSRRRELLHCGECPFQTKNPKRLAAHETGHKRVSGFKCPVCSFRSTSAGFLKRHAEGHGLASIPWPPVYEGEPRASASSALKAASQKKKPPTPTTTTTSFSKQKSDDMPPVLKPSAPSLTQQNKSLARNSKGQFAPKDELEMDNEGAEPPVLEFNEDSEVKENLPRCRVCSFVTAHRAELTAHFRRAHPALHSRRAKARKAWRWCRTCGIFIRRYGPWTLHRLVLHKPPTNKRAMKQMLSERRRLLPPAVRRELVCKSGAESGSESVADKSSGESPSSQSSPNARLQFCPECPFRTANKMEMTRHHENHTLKLAHQCEKCSFSCKNMLSLVHHRLMHERAEQRKKPDADQANKTPTTAADDDDDDQPVDAPTTPAAPSTPSLLKCEDCPYHAKVIWDMKAHRKMHIGNRKYRCDWKSTFSCIRRCV